MGRIIRICELALGGALLALPSVADATREDMVGRYASARLSEIGEQDDVALKGYLKLYKEAPDSEILADRLFDSAIRAGDMPTAVRAARARELRNGGNGETALLLFAEAWRAKNWRMADLAADEAAMGSNLAFMTPILKNWVRVAQGQNVDLPDADADKDGFFAYYSADQRIYLDLASGQFAKAKVGLRAIASQSGSHVRDVMIAGAETLSGQGGDPAFAEALMRTATGSDQALLATRKAKAYMPPTTGLSAFYGRIASALVEQGLQGEGLVLARAAHWIASMRPNVQLTLAQALDANGLQEEALTLLDSFEEGSPYSIVALESRINMLIAAQNAAPAVSIAKQAVKAEPNSMAAKLLYARAQEASGNLPEVISTYREMIDAPEFSGIMPRQQAGYRLLLASALDKTGDWSGAKSELEQLLIVDPNNAQALNYLGYSLLDRGGDRTKATAMVKQAYDIEPKSSAITDSLGWAYYLQGDAPRALPLLESAAKDAGTDIAINEHLGDVYWAVGRRRDARYAWRVASHGAEGDAAARLAQKIDTGPLLPKS